MNPIDEQVQRLAYAAAKPQIDALVLKIHATVGDSHLQVALVAFAEVLADGLSPWDAEAREIMLDRFVASVRDILARRLPE